MKRADYPMDDFGSDIRLGDIPSDGYMAHIRFAIDGAIEGIAEGILSGNCSEEALSYFGLIA